MRKLRGEIETLYSELDKMAVGASKDYVEIQTSKDIGELEENADEQQTAVHAQKIGAFRVAAFDPGKHILFGKLIFHEAVHSYNILVRRVQYRTV